MERRRPFGADDRWNAYGGAANDDGLDGAWGVGSTASTPMRRARAPTAAPLLPAQPALRDAVVAVYLQRLDAKRASDSIVLVDADLHRLQLVLGLSYGAREYDASDGVMKKCLLRKIVTMKTCLRPSGCRPACRPVGRRPPLGDLGDPTSEAIAAGGARGECDLMPEMGYRPTNKYLPPRPRQAAVDALPAPTEQSAPGGLLAWVDAVLSRWGPAMHPALSVIVFTTTSGAGYGLLAWLGWRVPGLLAVDGPLGWIALALSS